MFLWRLHWTFGFHKNQRISWPAQKLSASQGRHCVMELILIFLLQMLHAVSHKNVMKSSLKSEILVTVKKLIVVICITLHTTVGSYQHSSETMVNTRLTSITTQKIIFNIQHIDFMVVYLHLLWSEHYYHSEALLADLLGMSSVPVIWYVTGYTCWLNLLIGHWFRSV
jgi:hypothetical protein